MDVVVVGSCITDLISYVARLPEPGETLLGHKFLQGFGGKGANQCVMSARLGANTAMVAKVGKDSFGDDYVKNLKENHVNTDHVLSTDQAATGTAAIAVENSGQNNIIVVAGANLLLTETELLQAENLIKQSKVLVCQLEIQPQVSLEALKLAKKHGVLTIMNPAPAIKGLDAEFYTHADVFCLNETEASTLTGMPVASVADAEKIVSLFLEWKCQTVIITLGAQGSVYATQDSPRPVHIPCRTTKVVDSTGAGDAYVGALAYYMSRTEVPALHELLCNSGELATLSVGKEGTQTSYISREYLPSHFFR